LVGDAAYGPSTATGMGTTAAMVGAYILAGEIGRHCVGGGKEAKGGIEKALVAYEEKFRPFMDQVQKGINENTVTRLPSSAFGIAMINWVLGVASFFKFNVFGEWGLKEKVTNWELPEYEELQRGMGDKA